MISPASLAGGGFRARTCVFEPASPTLPAVDADVAGGLRVERLLFRAHDRFQARVARLVDRVADADHGRQLDLDGVVAVLGLALAAQLAVGDVDLDHLRQRGHLQVVGDDGADRVALAVIGLLAQQDQIRALRLKHLRQRVAGGADVGAGQRVVGEVDRAIGAERDRLVQGADRRVGAHRHRDDLLDRDRPTLLDLHSRLEGVRVEGVEVFLAAAIQTHRVRVDALLNRGVRDLLDQDADLQVEASLGMILSSSRVDSGRLAGPLRAGMLSVAGDRLTDQSIRDYTPYGGTYAPIRVTSPQRLWAGTIRRARAARWRPRG